MSYLDIFPKITAERIWIANLCIREHTTNATNKSSLLKSPKIKVCTVIILLFLFTQEE